MSESDSTAYLIAQLVLTFAIEAQLTTSGATYNSPGVTSCLRERRSIMDELDRRLPQEAAL